MPRETRWAGPAEALARRCSVALPLPPHAFSQPTCNNVPTPCWTRRLPRLWGSTMPQTPWAASWARWPLVRSSCLALLMLGAAALLRGAGAGAKIAALQLIFPGSSPRMADRLCLPTFPTPNSLSPACPGALYSYVGSTVVDGFGACLMCSVAFAALSCAIDLFLHDDSRGACGAGCGPGHASCGNVRNSSWLALHCIHA